MCDKQKDKLKLSVYHPGERQTDCQTFICVKHIKIAVQKQI